MNSTNIVLRRPSNLSTPSMSNGSLYCANNAVYPENVIIIIIGIISVFANAFLLYVMYKDPLKKFRTKISYLVICLGTADLLTAFNGVLYGFLNPFKLYHIALWYIFWHTVLVSVLTVFGMCVERWLAILYPFRCNSIFTKQATLYFCIGVWILCAALATSIHFLPKIMPFILSSLMEVFLLMIVLLYLGILRCFRRAQRQTSAVEEVTQQKPEREDKVDEESGKPTSNSSRKTAFETQLLIVVSILVVLLFVTFIPYNLGIQIHYGYLLFDIQANQGIIVFRRYFFPFKFLNFLLNPFVYAWRLDQYRKSFVLVLPDIKLKTRLHSSSASATSKQTNTESKGNTDREPHCIRSNTN